MAARNARLRLGLGKYNLRASRGRYGKCPIIAFPDQLVSAGRLVVGLSSSAKRPFVSALGFFVRAEIVRPTVRDLPPSGRDVSRDFVEG
jgi:hypothetical protein